MRVFPLLWVLLSLLVSPAFAWDVLGIWYDMDTDDCTANIILFEPLEVHVAARIHTIPGGVTAAEFRIANYPGNPGYPIGVATENWATDLTIGDVSWDFSIAFSEPQLPPWVYLGSIEFIMFDPNWIAENHIMFVAPGYDCDCLVLVDNNFELVSVTGGWFCFNADDYDCACSGIPTALEESDWSRVKTLF